MCSAQSRSRGGGAAKRKRPFGGALYLYYRHVAETHKSHRLSHTMDSGLGEGGGGGDLLILRVLF